MKGTENIKGLDAQGICSIIKKCSECGVSLLKFGDLEIWSAKTGSPQPGNPYPYPVVAPTAQSNKNPDAEISEQQHAKLNREALTDNEAFLRDQQMEELKITDPLAYEKMLRDGDLADADDQHGDDE